MSAPLRFLVLAALWLTLSLAQAAPPLRVLFVGNSYFYYNNSLHNHLKGLIEAHQPSLAKQLEFKSATIGGADLGQHPIEWLTQPGRLGVRQPFEVVILAGNSADALHERSAARFQKTVVEFAQVIQSRGGRTALYMTPAYTSPHRQVHPDNLGKISRMYTEAGQRTGAQVLPVGASFALSYQRRPDIRLHDAYDGSHPSLYGTYLAACVLLAHLYGINPVGNTYNIHGQVPTDVMAHLQQVAWDSTSTSATAVSPDGLPAGPQQ